MSRKMSLDVYNGIKLKDSIKVKSHKLIPKENVEADEHYTAIWCKYCMTLKPKDNNIGEK